MVVVGPIDSWSVLNDSVGRKHPQSQVQSTDGRSINLQKIFCFRVKIKPNFSARGDQKSFFLVDLGVRTSGGSRSSWNPWINIWS